MSGEAEARWGANLLPDFIEPVESARGESPEPDKYTLNLLTPNTKNRIHSQFNNLDVIRRLNPEPLVSIHPDDARPRGISNGAVTRIFNDRGEIKIRAHFDYGIKPGCLTVTNGWWASQGCAVNACSLGRETDMGHGAAFHDNLVEIESV
jgi:anaerobic selenocysteine-containing dehydrogenase